MAVMEDDHDTLQTRQLLDQVPDPRVASGLGRCERRDDAVEEAAATVDPIAARDADSLQPALDRGRVPQLAKGLTPDDVCVLDGVLGGLRADQRPRQRKEAWPAGFKRDVEPLTVQSRRIRKRTTDGGEPRWIGAHCAGATR